MAVKIVEAKKPPEPEIPEYRRQRYVVKTDEDGTVVGYWITISDGGNHESS